MAKLTLSFKDRLLSVHPLGEGTISIGRDPDCTIHIESLAVAPRHAELVPSGPDYLLLALDPGFPVRLNEERVDQASLSHGDQIQIGKHQLTYSAEEPSLAPTAPKHAPVEVKDEDEEVPSSGPLPAYLQVQSGQRIGHIVFCRRAATRLDGLGVADVIVTREGDRYHLLRLNGGPEVRLGGMPVTATAEVRLNDNDLIEIGELRLRFFSGRAASEAG